mgnify:CR=1 FL=1|tara:strand:- start:12631 stop:14238 length:1608 start_codon:yes stop_codon:yes gene_type:complete
MTQATTSQNSIQRQRKNVAFFGKGFGGMQTFPYTGNGLQRVDNMAFTSQYLESQPGVSTEKDTAETNLYGIGAFQKTDGTYQKLYVILDGSDYKLRALEEAGTITTPTGGAGDVTFDTASFRFAQVGATGYVGTDSTTYPLYSWNGAALTAITVSGGTDPDAINSMWVEGKRLAITDKSQGFPLFSQISTTLTAWGAGAGSAVSGSYDSMPRIPTCGIYAAGYSIIFTEQEGKANKVTPTQDNTDILVTTGIEAWNCNVGFDSQDKITVSDNFVYGAKETGLYQVDPTTGKTNNLIENAGAIERYWNNFDFDDAKVVWYPREKWVCIFCKESGDAVNSIAVLYSEEYNAFYLRTNTFVKDAVLAGDDLFAIEDSGGLIVKLFDRTASRVHADSSDQVHKMITEWDGLGDTKLEKRLKRVVIHAAVFPDDEMIARVYKNGDTQNPVIEQSFTGGDLTDTSGGVTTMGEYVLGVGNPDMIGPTSDKIERFKAASKGSTFCVEIECTTNNNFQIYSVLLEYKSKGRLIKSLNMANNLF